MGLGRGLNTLIPKAPIVDEEDVEQVKKKVSRSSKSKKKAEPEKELTLPIDKIEPNPDQPRNQFDEDTLQELSDSIKQYGMLQPILVTPKDDFYEIIAGERRWRAAKLAGLNEVPVMIRKYNENEVVEIALIENIQRDNLNPIEEAMAYKRLMEEFQLKQDEVAGKVSKSRAAITNSLRLLKLDPRVQKMLEEEMISTGHARALLAITNKDQQYEIAQKVFDEKLSVRDIEKLVKDLKKIKKNKKEEKDVHDILYTQLEESMKQVLGSKVTIKNKKNNKGKIEIEYYSQDELERIVDMIRSISEEHEMTNFLNSVSMEYVVIGLAGVLALALILVIVALVKVSKLKKRYEKFLSGKDGKSLEESIIKKFEKLNEIIVEQDFLEGEIQRIDEEHRSSFSKMEVYKYNAFSDMGGETSFVIALLDHNNNGTLLNGMSSQNATYVYAKEIKDGAAKVALSDEEKTTLEKCMNK